MRIRFTSGATSILAPDRSSSRRLQWFLVFLTTSGSDGLGTFGLAGPGQRRKGGTFLLVGPGVRRSRSLKAGILFGESRTNHVTMLFRAFLEDNDPAPPIARTKETLKIYPYQAGGFGNSVGSYLVRRCSSEQDTMPKRTTPKLCRGFRTSGQHHPTQQLWSLRNAERTWCKWNLLKRWIPNLLGNLQRLASLRARSLRPMHG